MANPQAPASPVDVQSGPLVQSLKLLQATEKTLKEIDESKELDCDQSSKFSSKLKDLMDQKRK